MGVKRLREGCVRQKTRAELEAENQELRKRVEALEGQTGSSKVLDALLGEVSEDDG